MNSLVLRCMGVVRHKEEGAAGAGLRERKKLARRGRIVESAWELFREKGFEAATMREIAERADVGVGTVFVYAKSKSDLLVLVYWEAIRETVRRAFTSLPKGGTLADELTHVFTKLFDMYARDTELSRAYIREVLFQPGPARQEMDELTMLFFRTAAERMEAAKSRGEIGDHFDPVRAAQNFFGLYFFALTAWLGGWVAKKEALASLRASVELQVEGLRPRAAGGKT